ncbi:DUF2184 domain-containing protein [Acinetobacter larvae]|uniref:DUF2184 domain-containing protein n=1 Tax=Acinetobacter larvae TaxID=1789224 RepID=A0A1B2LZW4_9GAMM|nr:DUF2184 domain-containing protein [Acinetobacter larvae]AOA58323.1 DUF2184 domain-containing protein [Acinetobacter larvae]
MPQPLNIQALQRSAGIVFSTGHQVQELDARVRHSMAMDSGLITTPNAGIPALFTQWVDPHVIEVLVEPMKMAEAFTEVKKGDWTTSSAMFPMVESVGETSGYGDFNENGMSDANTSFPSRQPYHYQTIIRVGEREMEIMGAAKIDWASRKQISAVLTLNKFQNKSYIYGVKGLENYGMINDPNLLPSITDTDWTTKDGGEIYESIQKLFKQLVKQTGGLIDRSEKMTLILSPDMDTEFTKTNQYNVNVTDQLKKNFPNLSIVTVPEYSTGAGELLQLIVDEYQGQKTAELAFTEKMRVHPLIQGKSGWEQKRSQGTFGAIIYRPLFIASALVG